jgi:hypothetical protein
MRPRYSFTGRPVLVKHSLCSGLFSFGLPKSAIRPTTTNKVIDKGSIDENCGIFECRRCIFWKYPRREKKILNLII